MCLFHTTVVAVNASSVEGAAAGSLTASSDEVIPKEDLTLGNGRFVIQEKLGQGSFGKVFAAFDRKRSRKVAIKVEHMSSSGQGQLRNEMRIMDLLGRPVQQQGFAELFFFSQEGPLSILVMDALGMSLEDSIKLCGGVFLFPTAALAAEQAIHYLAYMHSKGIVHRDIKSQNFLWGTGKKMHQLHIIDFGMSTRYFIKKHTRFATGKQLTGTARFASINAMKGHVQSRRDDLESLGYLLIHALSGSLPWSGIQADRFQDKLKMICDRKESMPLSELCQGCPEEFQQFLQYCRTLHFEERPDYSWLVSLFRSLRRGTQPPTEDWQVQWLAQEVIDTQTMAPLATDQPCPAQPDDAASSGSSFPEISIRPGLISQDLVGLPASVPQRPSLSAVPCISGAPGRYSVVRVSQQ